ncbi:MAG: hypothetical protein JOY70_02855 [Acidisphaera sp.]|nr:hypothetical protein [Acidisphaera sp.]MBV9812678.1 hypothetical protein [Acetobacteraceae bacterium]
MRCGPAWGACAGPPYDQLDFWLGSWHDPASPPAEHYVVTRTAEGCAIEEVLTGGDGKIQGVGLSGWDTERREWRQFWADADKAVTTYTAAPGPDGSFVLTADPKAGGKQSRYTYRNIRPDSVDADYATRSAPDAPWSTVWKGHYDRTAPPGK